jgi:hypothetical protein
MNTQKFLTTGLLLAMTVLIALGGAWDPAAARSGVFPLEAGETIELGRQGLYATNIPVGVSHVYLDMVGGRLPARFNQGVGLKYRLPAMEVRFLNQKGGPVEEISALVYVFFNITGADRALWSKGGRQAIAIWYASEETGRWEVCPTFFVEESRDNGTFDRLACLAPVSGYYVLGRSERAGQLADPPAKEE